MALSYPGGTLGISGWGCAARTLEPRGGDSYMEQTGMLVGNFEFNP